jgi:ribosomal protein S18 acetylase RimI-like enzyme
MVGVTARGERATFRAAILDRIDRPVRYAAVVAGDEVVAVGMGVVDADWLGVFSMATLPEHRRRGHATRLLGALKRFGAERSATRAYLQTEHVNAASHGLYEGLGFTTAYGYHYRTRA